MLHSDRLVFVELHKTGSTRVVKLLAEVAGPDIGDKHATYANALAGLGKPVVGYVCDPLNWYLALWKHGCAGKGDLRKRLTDPAKWAALFAKRAARAQEAGKHPPGREIPEGWGAEHARTAWYGNPESPQAFREWLKAVLVTRGIRRLVNNAYNNSPVQKIAGLMTFEYFTTFVRDSESIEKWVDSPEALLALNSKKAITQHFVRAESPGADLLKVLAELGLPVSSEQAATALAWDEGTARNKQKQIDAFYDAEARHWVQRREKVIFKIFGYVMPAPESAAAQAPLADGPAVDEAAVDDAAANAPAEPLVAGEAPAPAPSPLPPEASQPAVPAAEPRQRPRATAQARPPKPAAGATAERSRPARAKGEKANAEKPKAERAKPEKAKAAQAEKPSRPAGGSKPAASKPRVSKAKDPVKG